MVSIIPMWKLFVLDRKTWYHISLQTNDYREASSILKWSNQIRKKKIIMIPIKYLDMDQILAINKS